VSTDPREEGSIVAAQWWVGLYHQHGDHLLAVFRHALDVGRLCGKGGVAHEQHQLSQSYRSRRHNPSPNPGPGGDVILSRKPDCWEGLFDLYDRERAPDDFTDPADLGQPRRPWRGYSRPFNRLENCLKPGKRRSCSRKVGCMWAEPASPQPSLRHVHPCGFLAP
jgi:hypothetical protein